jgi:hypothetical protein
MVHCYVDSALGRLYRVDTDGAANVSEHLMALECFVFDNMSSHSPNSLRSWRWRLNGRPKVGTGKQTQETALYSLDTHRVVKNQLKMAEERKVQSVLLGPGLFHSLSIPIFLYALFYDAVSISDYRPWIFGTKHNISATGSVSVLKQQTGKYQLRSIRCTELISVTGRSSEVEHTDPVHQTLYSVCTTDVSAASSEILLHIMNTTVWISNGVPPNWRSSGVPKSLYANYGTFSLSLS